MKRIEGFVNIDEMLRDIGLNTIDIYDKKENDLIKYGIIGVSKIAFSFNYNNDEFFYKYKNNIIPYNELIANELLKDFNLPHIEYDLATFGTKKGVISKNYKNNNFNYIYGEEILLNFWNDDRYIEEHNNLDDIWDALEYRYHNYENKREIISHLMNRIVQIYIFDIITCQSDRHSQNWEIMESENLIDIAPIYDNERIFLSNGKSAFISLTMNDDFNQNILSSIKDFKQVSSEKYANLIREKLWIISDENLHSIFERIENKTEYPMPNNIKEYYLTEYKRHREILEKTLEEHENIRRR